MRNNEELVALIRKGIDTINNMELLYNQNRSFIYQIAKRYISYSDIEDLMQEAYFGLCEAVEKYENDKEVKFIIYAAYWIKQSINRYIERNGKIIRIPAHVQTLIYKYKRTVASYFLLYGENPDDEYLRKELNLSYRGLVQLKKNIDLYNTIKSLDEPLSDEEDSTYYDLVPSNEQFEDDLVDKCAEEEQPLWSIVKANATKEENEVLVKHYKEGKSYEVVSKEMGISRDRVRILESKGIRKLRREKVSRLLQEKYDIAMAVAYKGSVSRFNNSWTSSTENAAIKLINY